VRPREVAGRTLRGLAVDLVAEVRQLERRIANAAKRQRSSHELDRSTGSGPRPRFASYTGTAPIDASSGDVVRLSRAGDRQLNSGLANHPDQPRHTWSHLQSTETRSRQESQVSVALPEQEDFLATVWQQIREDTRGQLYLVRVPLILRTPTLRISPFPDHHRPLSHKEVA
jgi:hypothetical protein